MRRAAKASIALTGMLLVALPSTGKAIPTYDSEVQLSPFIYYHLYLQSGTQYTIETKNLTSGGDTVLHVLYDNGSSIQQIAANDDSTGWASKVVFSAPATGFYTIWVRSYSDTSGGKADLVANGSTVLAQAPFGGNVHHMAWSSGEQFRVATTRFTGSDDSMVFLLWSNLDFVQMDDDHGPGMSAFAQASSSEPGSARVVYGVFPGATAASYGRLLVQYPPNLSSDTDGDGLTDDLESLIGTSSTLADTDNDAIPDGIEAIGGSDTWAWIFSRSSTAPFGVNPVHANVYVEIDYMADPTNPSQSRQPYADLPTDASAIFSSDGFSDLTLIIDESVPWHKNIGMDVCNPAVFDCVDFSAQKASYFSTNYPERRPYFHYAVFGSQYDDGCSSGLAEFLGNDLEITLGGCAWNFTWNEQLGTLIHELGHNLNLTHNGNDDPAGHDSVAHNSVMNYRYQFSGTSPNSRHTYSSGSSNPFCAPCSTSPKQACITLKNANQCNTQAGAVCDCDVIEWWSAIDYDMTEGGNYNDGIAYSSSGGTLPPVARPLNLDFPEHLGARFDKDPTTVVSASELATAAAAELKRFVPASSDPAVIAAREAQAKQEQADVTHDVQARAANALKPNLGRRRASVAKRMALLKAQGLVEGRDFVISSDKSAFFMP